MMFVVKDGTSYNQQNYLWNYRPSAVDTFNLNSNEHI